MVSEEARNRRLVFSIGTRCSRSVNAWMVRATPNSLAAVPLNFASHATMKPISLEEFYVQMAAGTDTAMSALLPSGIQKEIGHFNVFNLADLPSGRDKTVMPYDRRTYYKISLIRGHNRVEYADKVVDIERSALLFASPKVPYHWLPQGPVQGARFCVFTPEFMLPAKSGVVLDELPIFQPGGYPVLTVTDEEAEEFGPVA